MKLRKLFVALLSLAIMTATMQSAFASEVKNAVDEEDTAIENSQLQFSPETQEWLEWFNSLSLEEQATVNYRPAELRDSNTTRSISWSDATNIDNVQSNTTAILSTQYMVTGGYEHAYDPDHWADLVDKSNCYGYMLNIYTTSGSGKIQPGQYAGKEYTSLTKSAIVTATKADMPYLNKSFRSSSYSEVPGYREYKVALVIAPNRDYHWYRQDSTGGWSHKRGLTAIDFRDASGESIYDPQVCDRDYGNSLNYSTWCGYYIVKY